MVFGCYEIYAMFLRRLKIKSAFFYACSKIIVFVGFSVGAERSMAGIE